MVLRSNRAPVLTALGALTALIVTVCACSSKSTPACELCGSSDAPTCERAQSGPGSDPDAGELSSCLAPGFVYYGNRDLVISIAWSPIDDYVLSGADGETRLLKADTASATLADADVYTAQGNRAFVNWSADGSFALSAAKDVRLLGISHEKGTITELATFSGHVGDVYAVAVSPDNSHVLSAGQDSTLRLLSADTAGGALSELTRFEAHAGKIYGLAWSPDGRYAATAGEDGEARLFAVDLATPALRELAHVTRSEWVVAVDWSSREQDLLIGTWGVCNALQLLAPDTMAQTIRVEDTFMGHVSGARTVRFRPDGAFAVSAGHDDTVRLFARAPGAEKLSPLGYLANNRVGVHDVAFSRDGKALIVAASHADQLTWVDISACVASP